MPTKNKNNEKARKLIAETLTKLLEWVISYFICSRCWLPSKRHNARDVNYSNLKICSFNISKKFVDCYLRSELFNGVYNILVWLLLIV
jgi:hypothetical protein